MEFSDLDWKTKEAKNEMWDFDLLNNRSEGDVFDVKFLQSQAQDQAVRGRESDSKSQDQDKISQVSKPAMAAEENSVKDEKLAKLVSAGFDMTKARQALESCGWDVEMAVDMMLNDRSGSSTSKSQTRHGSEAFGMTVFKGAQKVFDYSKKKIAQVVESSKSSGWKSERSRGNEQASPALSRETVSPGSAYLSKEQPASSPIMSSLESSKTTSKKSSPKASQVSAFEANRDSLLIGVLTESSETKDVTKGKGNPSSGDQNLGLLDSSIEFVADNSKNILNPTPSQFSAQSMTNDPLKSVKKCINEPLMFSSSSQSSQFSKNIPVVPNQQLNPQMANFSLKPASSNPSLNRSYTSAPKSANVSTLDSLDPFSGISDLRRSNTTTASTIPLNVKKQTSNDVKIIPLEAAKSNPKVSNPPFKNFSVPSTKTQVESTQHVVDLLDGFGVSSASGGGAILAPSSSGIPSNTKNISDSGKKPLNQSFMIFDSISGENRRNLKQSDYAPETFSQRAKADIYKDKGNELFKSGQYADAEIQYTRGIKSVSGNHPILAALYNNRAGARLKIGSYIEAIQDCNRVQELEPNEVKSLLRRAQAYEALEKWDEAQSDYRKILVVDPSVKSVSQSLARCGKALQSSVNAEVPTRPSKASESINLQSILQPAQQSFKSHSLEVTAAVQYVREKNRQAENDDALKLALKDQVDDKIQLWRKGKEDNLRALLSSLDAVLWKELEWKTINLSEILTPSQVKVKYLRAIGKVHPDKLGSNLSVENQLIANSVFSTLNKAWDSFKIQNGM